MTLVKRLSRGRESGAYSTAALSNAVCRRYNRAYLAMSFINAAGEFEIQTGFAVHDSVYLETAYTGSFFLRLLRKWLR